MNQEIYFNKDKAKVKHIVTFFFNLVWVVLIYLLLNLGLSFIFLPCDSWECNPVPTLGKFLEPYLIWIIIIYLAYGILSAIYNIKLIETLEYKIEENKIIRTNRFITRNTEAFQLHVVQTIDIKQTLPERVLNLYSVTIHYGFSGETNSITLDYLTEELAEEIEKEIKPTGKKIQIT